MARLTDELAQYVGGQGSNRLVVVIAFVMGVGCVGLSAYAAVLRRSREDAHAAQVKAQTQVKRLGQALAEERKRTGDVETKHAACAITRRQQKEQLEEAQIAAQAARAETEAWRALGPGAVGANQAVAQALGALLKTTAKKLAPLKRTGARVGDQGDAVVVTWPSKTIFAKGQPSLARGAATRLAKAGALVSKLADHRLAVVVGHDGQKAAWTLGNQRAAAVMAALIDSGVEPQAVARATSGSRVVKGETIELRVRPPLPAAKAKPE